MVPKSKFLRIPPAPAGFKCCVCCGALVALDAPALCHDCDALDRVALVHRACECFHAQYALYRRRGRAVKLREVPADKICPSCYAHKARDQYHGDARRLDGLQAECKTCRAIRRDLRRRGALALWPGIRDGMRAAAAKNNLSIT